MLLGLSVRSAMAEASVLSTSALVIYYFVATTHVPAINHDILMASLVVFQVTLAVGLMDFVDKVRQVAGRRIG